MCSASRGEARAEVLQLAVFNWTGSGCSGYHYDPLFPQGHSVEGSGPAVVVVDEEQAPGSGSDARWNRFTPKVIAKSLCQARTWADGFGGQCDRKPDNNHDLCKRHLKSNAHGKVTGDIPDVKFKAFETAEKARMRKAGGSNVA